MEVLKTWSATSLIVGSRSANHAGRVQLSIINSGSTYHNPPQRGRGTFPAPKDYPFEDRWKKYFRRGAVAELTVDRAVPDVSDLALSVEFRRGTEMLRTLRSPVRRIVWRGAKNPEALHWREVCERSTQGLGGASVEETAWTSRPPDEGC